MPIWFRSFARRVPVAGWLAGALVVAVLAAYYFARRARILAGRLRAERDIARIRAGHQKYIQKQLEGHARTSGKVAREWHKLTSRAQSRRDELRRQGSTAEGLADAWNHVFRK